MQMAVNDFQHDAEGRRIVRLPNYLNSDGKPVCPKCGLNQNPEITHSQAWVDGVKRRRRVCQNDQCDYVFPATVEVFEDMLPPNLIDNPNGWPK
jgi:hypothetical protein